MEEGERVTVWLGDNYWKLLYLEVLDCSQLQCVWETSVGSAEQHGGDYWKDQHQSFQAGASPPDQG